MLIQPEGEKENHWEDKQDPGHDKRCDSKNGQQVVEVDVPRPNLKHHCALDHAQVLAEAIQDAAKRRRIEVEVDRRLHDSVDHV